MNCTLFSDLLDAYVAQELDEGQRLEMEAHAAQCENCRLMLAAMTDCQGLDEGEAVPLAFSTGWRRMVEQEATMERPKFRSRSWQSFVVAAAVLVFVIGGTALTRGNVNNSSDIAKRNATPAPQMQMYDGAGDNGIMLSKSSAMADEAQYSPSQEAESSEKIIRTASLTLKTQVFDEDLSSLKELANQYAGRVEYLSVSGDVAAGTLRTAYITLRIPQESLDEFLAQSEGIARVTSQQESSQDVSESYYDTASRLAAQQEKMKRLLALMEMTTSVSELVEVESALSDTQYWIDYYTGQLQGYDSRVSFSSVDVTLREITVAQSEDITLWQRIENALSDSFTAGVDFLKDMVVFLIAALPWLLVCGLAAGVVTLVVKRKKARKQQ